MTGTQEPSRDAEALRSEFHFDYLLFSVVGFALSSDEARQYGYVPVLVGVAAGAWVVALVAMRTDNAWLRWSWRISSAALLLVLLV